MRIAMVSEHASPLAVIGGVDAGGQNVHVAALAEALARLGHEVVVHTRRDDGQLPRRVPLAPGVEVDHVDAGPPTHILKDELLVHMEAFGRDLAAQWTEQRPDIVHAHFWMSGIAALRATRTLGVPVVQTFHALGTVKRRHQGASDTSPPVRLKLEAGVARNADHIIATCRDELVELAAMGADVDRASVIPCGVDLDRFRPHGRVAARDERVPRLLVVGRLVPRKGVDDVVTALVHVPGAELVVAGGPDRTELDTDPEVRRLRDLAGRLGVADRIEWRGRVGRDEMPPLLRSADLVVCAPWYEPFGIVPVEAAACGVPVVATAVGGMLDTVVDGVTGLHVPPREPPRLAAAIRELLGAARRRRQMGRAAARRARQRYGWDGVAAATFAAYEAVLDRCAGRHTSTLEAAS